MKKKCHVRLTAIDAIPSLYYIVTDTPTNLDPGVIKPRLHILNDNNESMQYLTIQ